MFLELGHISGREAYFMTETVPESRFCPECGATNIFRNGFRRVSDGNQIQRFLCRKCGYRFSDKSTTPQRSRVSHDASNHSQVCVFQQEAKNLDTATETKTVAGDLKNQMDAGVKCEQLLTALENDGRKVGTITNYRKLLTRLVNEHVNLYDPEAVKGHLAKSNLKDNTKKTIAAMLNVWFNFIDVAWKRPKYHAEAEDPYIPSETLIDQLIAACGKRMGTYVQVIKETGARCGEISNLTWTSIDFQQRTVRIKPEKGSNPRTLILSPKAIEMLNNLSKDRETIFVNADSMRSAFHKQRQRIAKKLADDRILQIHFHTLRHWKITMEQHKTHDIDHVATISGHKSLDSTRRYIHLEQLLYMNGTNDEFSVKVAHTLEEAVKLLEVGYEFHVEMEGLKLFRKRN